jgi:hypothetical protein
MRQVRFDGQQDIQIKIDVNEDDKAYTVHAEIPGVKKRHQLQHRRKAGRDRCGIKKEKEGEKA